MNSECCKIKQGQSRQKVKKNNVYSPNVTCKITVEESGLYFKDNLKALKFLAEMWYVHMSGLIKDAPGL